MPVLDSKLCMKCFACLSACPNSAISESQNGPKFDNKKCKKCGTCAQMCPAGAITV
ncbi:Pyruvate synthase subunit PorD [uncultured archaeon]|nr:Pyruvate synthase subunit PorD [uncultured archaeon]